MTESTYDVFISYADADRAWVRRELQPRLNDAGVRFCTARNFRPGAARVAEMERLIETSTKTYLVLTPDYLASEWGILAEQIVHDLDPASRERRFIPVLKAPCEPPRHISRLTPVDFTASDEEEIAWAWRQLLTAVDAAPEQPAPAPLAPTRAAWLLAHPYPMPPNFTGRAAEREMLSDWLAKDAAPRVLVLRALGGFGKSALTWHWLSHDVNPQEWRRVLWWSFYEGDASFENFLAAAVGYLGKKDPKGFGNPSGLAPRQQLFALLQLLTRRGTLLVLDGFERVLRAYGGMDAAYRYDDAVRDEATGRDCLSPLAEEFLRGAACLPGIRAKVLLTTRLLPRPLERHGCLLAGCREVELTAMQPADAVAFFRARGVRGSRPEIERACKPYGYHPLSLNLLAGMVARDTRQPGDIATARRLDVSGDLVQRRHHVLQHAYDSLTPARQQLLSRIACFRGPVRYDALRAAALSPLPSREPPDGDTRGRGEGRNQQENSSTAEEKKRKENFFTKFLSFLRPDDQKPEQSPPVDLETALRDLTARGLLHHDHGTGRYDLHPIVRRYAYDRLAAPARAAAHAHLRDYFEAVPAPDRPQSLDDLAPVIELYHHTVRAEQYDEAFELFRDRLATPLYFQFGAYQLRIDLLRALFPDGEDELPRLKDESDQAWTLAALANSYSLSGQPRRAVPLSEIANDIYENQMGDKRNLAIGLGNLAHMAQIHIGALRAAEANLRRSVALCREIEDEFWEAVGRQELGRLLAYRGVWEEAEEELAAAVGMFEKQSHVQSQGIVWAYRAVRGLLMMRKMPSPPAPLPLVGEGSRPPRAEEVVGMARRALELADETANDSRFVYPVRDYVRAHWVLGAALRAAGEYVEAERHLDEALTRCRGINAVDAEVDILIDLARLRVDKGETDEARRLAAEAQEVAARCGYVMKEADARLVLARLALAAGDHAAALEDAEQARRLATCDGPPDYTYKVAYEEAGELLAR